MHAFASALLPTNICISFRRSSASIIACCSNGSWIEVLSFIVSIGRNQNIRHLLRELYVLQAVVDSCLPVGLP